jgi:voltage-gated potassium channel Kch
MRTAETVRKHFPHLEIIARARNRRHEYHLMDLGIEKIYRENFLSSLAMGEQALAVLGMDPGMAADAVRTFRAHDERLIRQQHAVQHDEEKLIQTAKDTSQELELLLRNDFKQS